MLGGPDGHAFEPSCRTLLDARMHVVPSFDKKVRNSRCMFPVFLVVPYECVKKNRICRTSFLCWRVSQLKCLKILVSCRVIRISRELRLFKVDSGFFLEGVFEGLAEPSQSVSHYQDKIGGTASSRSFSRCADRRRRLRAAGLSGAGRRAVRLLRCCWPSGARAAPVSSLVVAW